MFRINRLVSSINRSGYHGLINRPISSIASAYKTHHSALSKSSINPVHGRLNDRLLINQPAVDSSSSKHVRSRGSRLSNHLQFSVPFIRDDTPRLPPIMWIYPKTDQSSDTDRPATTSTSLNDQPDNVSNDDQSNCRVESSSQSTASNFRQSIDQSNEPPIIQDEGQSTSDPDGGFSLDADSAHVSLVAFAEFEAKQRAKKLQAEQITTQPLIQNVDPANHSPGQSNQTTNQQADDDPMAASMDAFVALERALALKKLKAKQEYLDDPTAKPHVSADQSNNHSTDRPHKQLEPPRMPEPYECCGMSCPNCVWITYAQEMHDYEDQKAKSSSST